MRVDLLARHECVAAVVLFGSYARGDQDEFSDKDIFVMCKDLCFDELIRFRQLVPQYVGWDRTCVTVYRAMDIAKMASVGSLFLWHLKLEGKIMFSRDRSLEMLLEGLIAYTHYAADIAGYRDMLGDVRNSLAEHSAVNEFDLALLYNLVRNTCMLLCVKGGEARFGRKDVYATAARVLGHSLPVSECAYEHLFLWKVWYERGVRRTGRLPDYEDSVRLVNQVEQLIEIGAAYCL